MPVLVHHTVLLCYNLLSPVRPLSNTPLELPLKFAAATPTQITSSQYPSMFILQFNLLSDPEVIRTVVISYF